MLTNGFFGNFFLSFPYKLKICEKSQSMAQAASILGIHFNTLKRRALELGVYKTVLDNMSDMLNQMNKYTLRYQFNQLNHRLHILTNVQHNVIMEAYANIPQENLFRDDLFFKYVTGYAKQQLGNMMGRYDFTLPGGVKIQAADLVSQGKEEVKEVEEEIKGQSTSSWFIMVKK